MDFEHFRETLKDDKPPEVCELLAALWHERKGDWKRAHEIAQEIESEDAAWVHAYLHRREGDLSNAGYWYRRAGRPVCNESMDSEWETIARALLS